MNERLKLSLKRHNSAKKPTHLDHVYLKIFEPSQSNTTSHKSLSRLNSYDLKQQSKCNSVKPLQLVAISSSHQQQPVIHLISRTFSDSILNKIKLTTRNVKYSLRKRILFFHLFYLKNFILFRRNRFRCRARTAFSLDNIMAQFK